MRISEIRYVSKLADVDEENDNIDVLLKLSDGRVYSFVVATPNNMSKMKAKITFLVIHHLFL